MNSILLSFVGNQDPFSKNHTEGSIVSLVRHLTAQNHTIIRAILLHTSDTASNAKETQDWLESDSEISARGDRPTAGLFCFVCRSH